ncbi:type VII toxin-antitoxin system HepT family RNase toxin [Anabaena lutea]|uniref:DUF86 domain-containing protein n=1 Tax=Anabaena lutea FACHB-196 TaxID=2692881 RepID=A0ABR8F9U9_9NOST|nr:DUF86 domain-containing protein [Anabaena lutea]MBD2566363.1 DUF86 domain-containing protein [Anabaena lutea FACHB-196]
MDINDLIATKANLITKYYKTLEKFTSISLDEFLSDYCQQLLAERLLYLITQTAIDINQQIISKINPENSSTTLESFTQLAKYQVITRDLSQSLTPSTGLIKHLTYEYDNINPNQVFKAINVALEKYPIYIRQIKSYLI